MNEVVAVAVVCMEAVAADSAAVADIVVAVAPTSHDWVTFVPVAIAPAVAVAAAAVGVRERDWPGYPADREDVVDGCWDWGKTGESALAVPQQRFALAAAVVRSYGCCSPCTELLLLHLLLWFDPRQRRHSGGAGTAAVVAALAVVTAPAQRIQSRQTNSTAAVAADTGREGSDFHSDDAGRRRRRCGDCSG